MNFTSAKVILTLVVGSSLAFGQTLAEGQEQARDNYANQAGKNAANARSNAAHFDADRKELVRNYYKGKQGKNGCPPGLAKKNNGCLPPGQAKKWQAGQRLDGDIKYSSLPDDLLVLLGRPPTGSHYGLVDSDIMLLADGTRLVLDVIANLGQ